MTWLISVFLFSSSALWAALPEINYTQEKRVEYLVRAFEAFKKAENSQMTNTMRFLRSQNRFACAAQAQQLQIQCLIQSATQNCTSQKPDQVRVCLLISDVIVSNLIEERTFLERNELNRILRNVVGSRDQLLTAITGRYARLTAELLKFSNTCKSHDGVCLSNEIDRFCVKKANEKSLAWQGCAGALMWFIGSNLIGSNLK